MKKLYFLLAVSMFSASALAQTNVITENFGYPDATSLSTSNATTSWFQHSGTQGQITVNAGKVNLVSGQTEDINKAFSTAYSMAAVSSAYKIVLTAEITVLNTTGLNATGDYFLSLAGSVTTANGTGGITALPGRIYVKNGTTGALLGTVNNSGTGNTPNFITTEIPFNTPTNITLTYEVSKDSAGTVILQKSTLVVGSETITNVTGPQAPPATIAGIALRQGGNTGNILVDNIVVNTFAPATLAVTDLSTAQNNFVKNTAVNDEINFSTKADVKVFSMNGQVVKAATVSENKNLDVADLAPGMYIVTGIVDGQAVSTKVMKK